MSVTLLPHRDTDPPDQADQLESTWTTLDGLRLHTRVSPRNAVLADAPAVVLVHGLGVSSRYFIPTGERLAPFYRVYLPDLPGSGRSDKPPRVLDVRGLSDALAAWMERVGPGRATFVGNSLGCQTITDFALRHPERVERLVLIGPTVDPHAGTLFRILLRGARDMMHEPLWYWFQLGVDYWTAGPLRTLQTLRLSLRDHIAERLPRLRVPTLVVRGVEDRIAPLPWAEEVARLLPAGRLAIIPEAAHVPHATAPRALLPVLRAFLDEPAM